MLTVDNHLAAEDQRVEKVCAEGGGGGGGSNVVSSLPTNEPAPKAESVQQTSQGFDIGGDDPLYAMPYSVCNVYTSTTQTQQMRALAHSKRPMMSLASMRTCT